MSENHTGDEARRPRVESLTGLRWIAAFGVFLFHVVNFAPIPKFSEAFTYGDAGVTFFYILSGFVLTWSFSPLVSTGTFYWRRFARVWPMLAVSTALAWYAFHQTVQGSWVRTVEGLALVDAWFKPSGGLVANPVGWSVSCEAFFYLLFPLLIRPILRARKGTLAVIALILLALEWGYWYTALRLVNPDLSVFWIQLSWFIRFPAFRLIEFLLGMIAASALRQGWRPRINLWFALALAPASIWVLLQGNHRGFWSAHWTEQGLAPACLILVIAAALRDIRGQWSFLRSKTMVTLGSWSYSFYLVHLSVLYIFVSTLRFVTPLPAWRNLKPILILAVMATALAWACYRWIEHPIEQRLRSLYPRRRVTPPAPAAVPAGAVDAATMPSGAVDAATMPSGAVDAATAELPLVRPRDPVTADRGAATGPDSDGTHRVTVG
jgi:peptidoglycan/LPS O-acetylase OafA/YrhL